MKADISLPHSDMARAEMGFCATPTLPPPKRKALRHRVKVGRKRRGAIRVNTPILHRRSKSRKSRPILRPCGSLFALEPLRYAGDNTHYLCPYYAPGRSTWSLPMFSLICAHHIGPPALRYPAKIRRKNRAVQNLTQYKRTEFR